MRRFFLLAMIAAVAACPRDEAPPPAHAPPVAPAPPVPAPTEPVATAAGPTAQLEWLDPDAVAVAYVDLPSELDLDAFSTVFALPPQLAGLLRDVRLSETGLAAVLPLDAPAPSTWLLPGALASQPRLSTQTYIVRRTQASPEDLARQLEAADFLPQTTEGLAMFVPRGAYPWKLVLLEPGLVGFVPVRALGSGLQPLTAGRDLPASEIETQLRNVFASEGSPVLELYAAGPLLHLDLGQEIAQWMMGARRWQRGLDVQVQLVPVRDLEDAAQSLRERDLSLESDRVRTMAERVAFSVEGPVVLGRLQLTAGDLAALRGP